MQQSNTDLAPLLIPPLISGASFGTSCTISNDTTTPNTVLDFTDTNGTSFTKSISNTFGAGNGQGGMGGALVATANTWYHCFEIVLNGRIDAYFDTSVAAVNAPSGISAIRYVGAILLDSSAHILAFYQEGQWFMWKSIPKDFNAIGVANVPALGVISIPLGIQCQAYVQLSPPAGAMTVWNPGLGNVIPTNNQNIGTGNPPFFVGTNSSSQIYYNITVNTGASLYTYGYINLKVSPIQ